MTRACFPRRAANIREPAQLRVELNHRGINMLRWPVDAKGLQKLIRSMAKNCSSGEVTATQPQRSEDAPATAVAATVDGKPVGAMVAVKVDLV